MSEDSLQTKTKPLGLVGCAMFTAAGLCALAHSSTKGYMEYSAERQVSNNPVTVRLYELEERVDFASSRVTDFMINKDAPLTPEYAAEYTRRAESYLQARANLTKHKVANSEYLQQNRKYVEGARAGAKRDSSSDFLFFEGIAGILSLIVGINGISNLENKRN